MNFHKWGKLAAPHPPKRNKANHLAGSLTPALIGVLRIVTRSVSEEVTRIPR